MADILSAEQVRLRAGSTVVASHEALRAALRKYGMHRNACSVLAQRGGRYDKPCDCGLDAALGDQAAKEDA